MADTLLDEGCQDQFESWREDVEEGSEWSVAFEDGSTMTTTISFFAWAAMQDPDAEVEKL